MNEKKEETLDSLSLKANEIMAENKYYRKKLSLYDKYINLTKEVITQCLTKSTPESAIEYFDKYISEIQRDYDNLNKLYEIRELPEYNELIDNCFSETTMGKPILEQKRNKNFYLEYSKIEKENIIKELKQSIKCSKKYQLFREPSRYTLVDMKEGAKEIEKTANELQQNMLYELKKCNKFKERIFKYNNQINEIKKNIQILNNFKKSEKLENESNSEKENSENKDEEKQKNEILINPKFSINFNSKKDLFKSHNPELFGLAHKKFEKNFDEDENINGSDDEKKRRSGERKLKTRKKKDKNKIILEFKKIKIEDLFELSSEEAEKENIIDDELNSDDEIVFAEKVRQPIKLTEFHIEEVEKEIPKINLAQIEYNKMKIVKEDNLYSIQRRKYRSQNIDNNIKELKKDIEKMKQKLEIIKTKEKVMKEYIEKVEKNYAGIRRFRKTPSVKNVKTKLIAKSLIYRGEEKIKEENIDDDEGYAEYNSDYENEQSEEEEKNNFKINNIKQSVNVAFETGLNFKKNGNKFLAESVNENMFNNNLRNKLKKIRNKSK